MKQLFILSLFFAVSATAQTGFWAKQLGGTGEEFAGSMAVDNIGNIYVTGYFDGTIDLNPGIGIDSHTSNGERDAFLCKLDANGNFIWGKTWGGHKGDTGNGIAVDSFGNIVVIGRFQDTVNFNPAGADTHISNGLSHQNNPYISKFDSNGNFLWAKTWGGVWGAEGYSVTVDPAGNIYGGGDFSNPAGTPVDFNPDTGVDNHYCNGFFDAWMVKYNANGNFVWAKTWGGADYDDGCAINVNRFGTLYWAGMFESVGVNLNPDSTGPADIHSCNGGQIDVFLSKFDTSGHFYWARTWGGHGNDCGGHVTVDDAGNAFVGGYYQDTVDFNQWSTPKDTIISAGSYDTFLSKIDASGNLIWATPIGGTGDERGGFTVLDKNGNIYMVGCFSGNATFDRKNGDDTLTSRGSNDIFIAKLDASGNFLWVKRMGGTGNDGGYSIGIDDSGNIYSSGCFTGTSNFDPGVGTFTLNAVAGDDIFLSKFYTSIGTEENADFGLRNAELKISQNPFIKSTVISYSIPPNSYSNLSEAKSASGGNILLTINDISGREVRTLINGVQKAGSYEVNLDSRGLPTGAYFLVLNAGKNKLTKKIILIK
ncbi:MAG: T9SS type A sorting domain-containing protein [bacterium]|nr:T9SS type A sorting domain-containing protein [bacterium]